MKLKTFTIAGGAFMLAALLSNAAVAQLFTADPGGWNDPLNWDTGVVPGTGDNVVVGDDIALSSATANIDADVPDYNDLRVGAGTGFSSSGTVNHSAGTANAGGWAFLGVDNADTSTLNVGTYNLTNTAIWNPANTFLGTGGGLDGTRTAEGYLNISDSAELNTGSLNVGNNDDNYGEVNQTGGTVSIANWFNVGDNTAGHGVYNMSGGSLSADQISVGQAENSTGAMHLSGTASVTQSGGAQGLRIGRGVIPDQTTLVSAEGLLSITGGGVSVSAANFSVGADETGEFAGTPTPTTTPAEGTLSFTSDETGISSIDVSGNVLLNDGSVAGFADLIVDLESTPVAGDVVLVDLGSTGTVTGTFMGLSEGASVPGSGGRTISYSYGPDGNDIALISTGGIPGDADGDGDVDGADFLLLQQNDPAGIADWESNYPAPLAGSISAVPEPASLVLMTIGFSLATMRRRR